MRLARHCPEIVESEPGDGPRMAYITVIQSVDTIIVCRDLDMYQSSCRGRGSISHL